MASEALHVEHEKEVATAASGPIKTGRYHVVIGKGAKTKPMPIGPSKPEAPMMTSALDPARLASYSPTQVRIIVRIFEGLGGKIIGISAFESSICITWKNAADNEVDPQITSIIIEAYWMFH